MYSVSGFFPDFSWLSQNLHISVVLTIFLNRMFKLLLRNDIFSGNLFGLRIFSKISYPKISFISFFLHHTYTTLSDINFGSLLISTISNQLVWDFASRRGLLISLIAQNIFEIGRRKIRYPELVYRTLVKISIGSKISMSRK